MNAAVQDFSKDKNADADKVEKISLTSYHHSIIQCPGIIVSRGFEKSHDRLPEVTT